MASSDTKKTWNQLEEEIKIALTDNSIDELKQLLNKHKNLTHIIISPTKQSLLHVATALKRPECAQYLIECGIDTALQDCNHETAMDYVRQSHCKVMKTIFKDFEEPNQDQEVVDETPVSTNREHYENASSRRLGAFHGGSSFSYIQPQVTQPTLQSTSQPSICGMCQRSVTGFSVQSSKPKAMRKQLSKHDLQRLMDDDVKCHLTEGYAKISQNVRNIPEVLDTLFSNLTISDGEKGEPYGGQQGGYSQTQLMEDENEQLEGQLLNKVHALKSLSIDIGHEVREQNSFLNGLSDSFDSTGGFLGGTMKRVQQMARAGHNRYICYLLLFACFVFFLIWLILKFR